MKLFLAISMLFVSHAFAKPHDSVPIPTREYSVGDQVDNLCFTGETGARTCTEDYANTVRVLVFNAGWCGPCNEEFDELGQRVGEFHGDAVTFISVSGNGWSRNASPDQTFLHEWRERHNLPQSMVLTGKRGEYGQEFGHSAIPNVAVLDKTGKLTYSETAPGVDATFEAVKSALRRH